MNIKFYKKLASFSSGIALICDSYYIFFKKASLNTKVSWFSGLISITVLATILIVYQTFAYSSSIVNEPVQACVIARDVDLTDAIRAKFAQCLGWEADNSSPMCLGSYQPITVAPLNNDEEIRIVADRVSFYNNKRSTLSGNVAIQQTQRIVNAQTAYLYRDAKTNQVTKIEFLGNVRYLEPNKLMIARKATINPQDKSGQTEDVLYRINTNRSNALLPAWGRASLIQRFANKNYLLKQATYTTCSPQDKSWDIKANSIALDDAKATGVARNAIIRVNEWPVLYAPYLSFPTNKNRKSGFLMPLVGYSNVGGLDFGTPYYWNIAPNHDFTFIPHEYTKRGVMVGGEYRYLTESSTGILSGSLLPRDKAFKNFLQNNAADYPQLSGFDANRWAYGVLNSTTILPNLNFNVNIQEVSDDYYLQDFSTNWAIMTQRQLLREASLTYATDHWEFKAMGQSYQTLEPINETPIVPAYERLPQLLASGSYYNLPYNANLNILGQYDQFYWPTNSWRDNLIQFPQGPRFHFNPVLAVPLMKPWGYLTPSVQVVENYYEVTNNWDDYNFNSLASHLGPFNYNVIRNYSASASTHYNRTIPRYSLDSGLYFERDFKIQGSAFSQTLEPRLFYLKVPYQNQTPIPVYDSGFMIFNMDQLFRTNRFSGFDRIGDTNQLSYALTSRWLSSATGAELANFSIGQIRYFADRKVQLCQSTTGYCIDDPNTFGYVSPTSGTSPVASRAEYRLNQAWGLTGDYIWDPARHATNNADLNLHYQPMPKAVVNLGYSYLVNGDVTSVRYNQTVNDALHQAIVAFAWPVTEKWSTLGAYSHNISKNYSMMSLAGIQYDSCCWAMRLLGGRTFKNLNATYEPRYNNNVYLQVLLKGLGSVANGDPNSILSTYIPGYSDPFK